MATGDGTRPLLPPPWPGTQAPVASGIVGPAAVSPWWQSRPRIGRG
ncbi:MAG TPA: hypothetical protein VIG50_07205 [Vicinamibacteria bacterium]